MMNLVVLLGLLLPTHYVTLDWTRSVTVGVQGYRMYRAASPNGPWRLVSAKPIYGTEFIDRVVVAGATYYYVCRAIGKDGSESGNSNVAVAKVPR